MSVETRTNLLVDQAHLDEPEDTNVRTGPQPTGQTKKLNNGLGLRKIIAATQTQRLRSKQLVSAAAKIYGKAPPQVDSCELEHVWDNNSR